MKLPILNIWYEESIEYLVKYSSQLWLATLNNTLLYDINWYIIWIKYNWVLANTVDISNKARVYSNRTLVSICADTENKKWWFYLIDLHNKAICIKRMIKYNHHKTELYFNLLKSFVIRDLKSLNNIIKQL
jgi:hypothetical protein